MKLSLKNLLISSPLVIGGLELGLRLIGYSFPALGMPDRVTGWSLRPGAEGLVRGENKRGVYVRINSDGLRDREHSIRKPAATIRIAVLGDSLCEATEVPLEKTFWAILEDKLSRCATGGQKVEVVNFGVAGYSTAQELLMLRTRVWKYEPDIVLLAFTGSDVSENFRPLSGQPLAPYFIYKDNQLVLDDSFRGLIRHEWLRNKWASAAQHLRMLQLVRQLFQRSRTSMPANDSLYAEPVDREWREAWSITEDLIRLIHRETVQHGAA
ncbi:MAG TPA: SGNH/GDSL hydrolase family protein [Bryobacteraceae bacterium]